MEKTRYGDGSVRPINATTTEGERPRDSLVARATAEETFRAGLGGGQGYGTRGGYAGRDLERVPTSARSAPRSILDERERVTMPGGIAREGLRR